MQSMETSSGEVCVPNINTRERRKRLLSGLVMLVVALAALAALRFGNIDRWWRLALFPLFAGAASGLFQWRDKT
jgi:heme A synthase